MMICITKHIYFNREALLSVQYIYMHKYVWFVLEGEIFVVSMRLAAVIILEANIIHLESKQGKNCSVQIECASWQTLEASGATSDLVRNSSGSNCWACKRDQMQFCWFQIIIPFWVGLSQSRGNWISLDFTVLCLPKKSLHVRVDF